VSRVTAELENALQTNELSNKEIERLHHDLDLSKKENQRLRQSGLGQKGRESEVKQLQNKIREQELLLANG
jgi:hypothetical protein